MSYVMKNSFNEKILKFKTFLNHKNKIILEGNTADKILPTLALKKKN